jgi:C-terminal processing protease CtpA/Prc
MGYVSGQKLGTIIGSTTAGTNGGTATFTVPGGFRVTFTGARVTAHDGHTPHHLVGITPDIPVALTVTALREGRDEPLERALAFIRETAK